jgi:hypothetical protein
MRLNWKVVFLAFLVVSSIAVTYVVATQNIEIVNTFGADPPKLLLDEPVLLEPIDDGPGG